jgi:hypothetical protein
MSAEDEWVKIKEHLLKVEGVQKQGESLKIHRKMFAMLASNIFIVKLPKNRVTEIIDSGEGSPHDFGTGKAMKEWVIIKLEFKKKWFDYAKEAMEFAKTLAK